MPFRCRYTSIKRLLIVGMLASASLVAGQTVLERAKEGELVFMRDEEPAMRRAFQVARETLGTFLETEKRRDPTHTGFALKVAISEGDDTEYFWVTNFKATGPDQFQGEIDNEPRIVKSVREGQRYTFSRDRVIDWAYIDRAERRMVGNFTLCALLTKEPPSEAAAAIRRFKLDCSRVKG